MPDKATRLSFAQAMLYVTEWATDECGDVDASYDTGCQETAEHLLACYLVQHGGHESCEPAGSGLIPWDNLPQTVGEWEEFLREAEKPHYVGARVRFKPRKGTDSSILWTGQASLHDNGGEVLKVGLPSDLEFSELAAGELFLEIHPPGFDGWTSCDRIWVGGPTDIVAFPGNPVCNA